MLIIEDDPRLRTTVAAFLTDEGLDVEAVGNGVEALDQIERHQPELLLLDMHLPLMDGWQLVNELRIRRLSIPVVVMTAAQEARRVAEEIGAVAYVSKPVSLPSLLHRLMDIDTKPA